MVRLGAQGADLEAPTMFITHFGLHRPSVCNDYSLAKDIVDEEHAPFNDAFLHQYRFGRCKVKQVGHVSDAALYNLSGLHPASQE